jgi:hypothetical protein
VRRNAARNRANAAQRLSGHAIEALTLHFKRVTESLLLTPTRADTYELVILWEKPSWDRFRKVMESLYKPEQLGEAWAPSRDYNAYDHPVTPHFYETPQTARTRPPSCGAAFMAARRQLNVATEWQAPFWLVEGLGAYGDYIVHKQNRWFTVYDVKQVPVGDWLANARKLAADDQLRPWNEMANRELRDWQPTDHYQSLAMAAFLLESEPARFLDLLIQLKRSVDSSTAIEHAYRATASDLNPRLKQWLLNRK